jgi:hypothetical protein
MVKGEEHMTTHLTKIWWDLNKHKLVEQAIPEAEIYKREWVGLTADEIWKCNKAETGSAVEFHICSAHQNVLDFAEAIEAKLKEKNV